MTPDDVAAYRAYSVDNDEPHVVALCDALTAAWAERDHMLPETEIRPVLECENLDVLRSALIGVKRGQIHMRERAERADAERDLWCQRSVDDNNAMCDLEEEIARLRRLMRPAGELTKRLEQAEAALARVRALCDDEEHWEHTGMQLDHLAEIRAAIEGDE